MSTKMAARRISGMGAIPHDQGVAFRVWAPHADSVSVVGTFNHWDDSANPLEAENDGYWYCSVADADIGDEYKFVVANGERSFQRIDPYAREVTHSAGSGVIHDPTFDWGNDEYRLPPWNECVIYEMHVGTFGRSQHDTADKNSDFDAVERLLDHLERLGVNVLQLMPTAEFAGDISWGYNPAHIFAVETAYGGPLELKELVRNAHRRGFGVLLDVVYNHFGPSDIDLWQFDGWSENSKGGIYFYNDWRAETPWGSTRPDYGRGEVRRFIFDNAMMWLDEYRIDGLRFDMTVFMRSVAGNGEMDLPEGWSLMQWINREISQNHPGHLTIAEDLQDDPALTRLVDAGGAGFSSQWDAAFVHPVRQVLIESTDEQRSMERIRGALTHQYNHSAFERVVYTESHDEVANGKARLPAEIHPDDQESWFAQKRSTLGAVLTLTAPGIPMLFQGQEFLQGGWFDDQVPLDWPQSEEFSGIVRLYRDLIRLRRNLDSQTRGLTGQHINVHHVNDNDKIIAYHRWSEGGPGDDVLVIANFANRKWASYDVGVPRAGQWTLRLNSDWRGYGKDFGSLPAHDVIAPPIPLHGQPATATISIGPYSALILSQGEHD